MKKRILTVVMVLLTAFVLHSAVRIEVLNMRAGNYLPRKDLNPDGTSGSEKWRISEENGARDQLRFAVESFGLLQYFLAPLLTILALVVFFKSKTSWTKRAAMMSVGIAAIAISLMLYREYYQSLGW